MRGSRVRTLWALLALWLAGCTGGRGAIELDVQGPLSNIDRLRVHTTVGGSVAQPVEYAPAKHPFALPVTFVLGVDGDHQGVVDVYVEALDAAGSTVATSPHTVGQLATGDLIHMLVVFPGSTDMTLDGPHDFSADRALPDALQGDRAAPLTLDLADDLPLSLDGTDDATVPSDDLTLTDASFDQVAPIAFDLAPPPDLQKPLALGFGSPSSYSSGSVGALAVGDFNGDHLLDLLAAGNSRFTLLQGAGGGSFFAAAPFGALLAPNAVAAADFTGDGQLDFVASTSSTVNLFVNAGGGLFASGQKITSVSGNTVFNMVAGFVDDGPISDFVVGTGTLALGVAGQPGNFAFSTPFTGSTDVVAADFSGDGHTDLAFTKGSDVSVLLGKGDGTFQAAAVYSIPSPGILLSLAAGDVNGDGHVDLVIGATVAETLVTLLNQGAGTFQVLDPAGSCSPGTSPCFDIRLADFDHDGFADAAGAIASGGLAIIRSKGNGKFWPPTIFAQSAANNVVVGDFNSDGLADVAFGGTGVTVRLNTSH